MTTQDKTFKVNFLHAKTLAPPAHDVILAGGIVVPHGQLQVTSVIIEHVKVKLLQPPRVQRLWFVL